MSEKVDNKDPTAKLDLRRYFLRKYHADGTANVLDCCQGSALLWRKLRSEFDIRSYWGMDLKPKKGRLKLDSRKLLAQRGWSQNVVDIDTYGSPWSHWQGVMENAIGPCSIFLTIGNQANTAISPNAHGFGLMFRLPESTPEMIKGKIARQVDVQFFLGNAGKYGTIVEAKEALSSGTARYIGVRFVPKREADDVSTGLEHKQSVKENAHV